MADGHEISSSAENLLDPTISSQNSNLMFGDKSITCGNDLSVTGIKGCLKWRGSFGDLQGLIEKLKLSSKVKDLRGSQARVKSIARL